MSPSGSSVHQVHETVFSKHTDVCRGSAVPSTCQYCGKAFQGSLGLALEGRMQMLHTHARKCMHACTHARTHARKRTEQTRKAAESLLEEMERNTKQNTLLGKKVADQSEVLHITMFVVMFGGVCAASAFGSLKAFMSHWQGHVGAGRLAGDGDRSAGGGGPVVSSEELFSLAAVAHSAGMFSACLLVSTIVVLMHRATGTDGTWAMKAGMAALALDFLIMLRCHTRLLGAARRREPIEIMDSVKDEVLG
eukprot:TRINITY_DN510_c1_g1_i12.p1 TRINITY_DN510_c1_g1~~TRINITY_DN510_c1_g1_i12.p1  ORF type:complete len:250 (+),score=52.79 TRINITY_DN510_c1_g1_i12:823-1572(+)